MYIRVQTCSVTLNCNTTTCVYCSTWFTNVHTVRISYPYKSNTRLWVWQEHNTACK